MTDLRLMPARVERAFPAPVAPPRPGKAVESPFARLCRCGALDINVPVQNELDSARRASQRGQAAALLARRVMDAEVRGMARALLAGSTAVYELGETGAVIRSHTSGDGPSPLRVERQRLAAERGKDQLQIDCAILAAARPPGQRAMALVSGTRGEDFFLDVRPVPVRAPGWPHPVRALAALKARKPAVSAGDSLLAGLFKLTTREAEVLRLLCSGAEVPAIARSLAISVGTVRFHLRGLFDKTGAKRQAELSALIARLGV